MRKSIAIGASMVAGAAASAILVTASPAAAVGCVRNNITTGYQGPGTVVNKASSSCHDLNLVHANDTSGGGSDDYAGFYRTSNGVWHEGSRGYLYAPNGDVNWLVLLSDVL